MKACVCVCDKLLVHIHVHPFLLLDTDICVINVIIT